jgi:hypothetical protein
MSCTYQRLVLCGAAALVVGCASSAISDFNDSGARLERDDGSAAEGNTTDEPQLDARAEDGASQLDADEPALEAGAQDAQPATAEASVDAGTGDAAETGAGADAAPSDANLCTDGDGDGTCDFADNCPAHANPGQADSDGDGAGDACDSTPAPCTAQVPSSAVSAGDASLSAVRINGGGNVASVAVGAKIELALEFSFDRCGLLSRGDARFVVTGFEGNRNGTCATLSAAPCPDEAAGSATLSITAPATPGTYYIVARGEQNRNCSNEVERSPRIAALCVR